ncbi:hypothetical protein [Kytococcus sedentarius]|uniref:hypothetical protein n=1 Tax=Kytococcus sedentarius TaxID=1276 RepID=UPI0035BBF622
MPEPLIVAEVVLGVLVLALVGWLLFSWWRRIRISGGHSTAVCVVRRGDDSRPAILRMGPRALEFHSLWGAGTTPFLTLRRTSLEMEWLDETAPAPGGRWVRLVGHGERGPGAGAENTLEVALSSGDGRALRAWQETLPPGHSVSLGL